MSTRRGRREREAANVFSKTGEQQYLDVPFRIVAEQDLRDVFEGPFQTWRVFCFKGSIELIFIDEDSGNTWHFTKDLQDLPFSIFEYKNNAPFQRPEFWEEILVTAEKLAAHFEFVRVDFSVGQNAWYFGELTFTPAAGIMSITPRSEDIRLGSLIDAI